MIGAHVAPRHRVQPHVAGKGCDRFFFSCYATEPLRFFFRARLPPSPAPSAIALLPSPSPPSLTAVPSLCASDAGPNCSAHPGRWDRGLGPRSTDPVLQGHRSEERTTVPAASPMRRRLF